MKKRIRKKILSRVRKEYDQVVKHCGSVAGLGWQNIANLGKKGKQFVAASVFALDRIIGYSLVIAEKQKVSK